MTYPKIEGKRLEAKFFSKHSWNADLIEFDGPLLSLYKNELGDDLLYVWLDCSRSSHRWGVIPVARESLRSYLQQEISLREIFVDSKWIAVFHTNSIAQRRNSAVLTSWDNFPDSYHPDKDSYLAPEIATDAAAKLAEEISEGYFLGLDGDMYIDDIAMIPKIYQQLYSFHYGLEHLYRPAVRAVLDRLAGNWTGGFSAVHLFSGLNLVTPSIHRAQVSEMRYNSPGHIKLDLLPDLAKRIEISAGKIIADDDFYALEEFYSSVYRYFKEAKLSGFDNELESKSRVLSVETLETLDKHVAFFFKLMGWHDYRSEFRALNIDSLDQLRALLAYYRRLRKLRPYLVADKLFLGESKLQLSP